MGYSNYLKINRRTKERVVCITKKSFKRERRKSLPNLSAPLGCRKETDLLFQPVSLTRNLHTQNDSSYFAEWYNGSTEYIRLPSESASTEDLLQSENKRKLHRNGFHRSRSNKINNQNNKTIIKTNDDLEKNSSTNGGLFISADHVSYIDDDFTRQNERPFGISLVSAQSETKVYKQRFWILFVFSAFHFFAVSIIRPD